MIFTWWSMMVERGPRRGVAESMRWLADRIAPEDAFVGGSMSAYLVKEVGWVLDVDGRQGMRL